MVGSRTTSSPVGARAANAASTSATSNSTMTERFAAGGEGAAEHRDRLRARDREIRAGTAELREDGGRVVRPAGR
ncbi:hypothetical protein HR12_13630 [Microbacterium sp. SUBG005]|nr:hypothetical protein HR12_13630 [Microbacterium sp. SUBG005]